MPRGRTLAAATALLALALSAQATTIYNGTLSIASTDPTQLGRLVRNGSPQTWANVEVFPGLNNTTTAFHYRTLDLDLSALQAGYVYGQYLQVTIDSSSLNTFLAGYLNTYNPASAATVQSTWLGDAGLSGLSFGNPQAFQLTVTSGNHLLLVLNEASSNGGLNQTANIIVEAFSDMTYTDLASAVPEPGSWLLMGTGAALLWVRRRRRTFGQLLLAAVATAGGLPAAHAQSRTPLPQLQPQALDAAVARRIDMLLQEKEARTPAQAKLGASLWYALQWQRGQALPDMDEVYRSAISEAAADDAGLVEVDIVARVSGRLLAQISAAGGQLGHVSAAQQAIRAKVPLDWLEALAALPSVVTVVPAARGTTNLGSVTGQGIISHKAKQVVAAGYTGAGVRVGVLSDSVGITVAQDQLVALKASGDLPADAAAVPGQDGGAAASEGTAMMEIVADIAPGTTIYFATASTSAASFADNIRALRAPPYNCDIIVDDYTYFNEGAFQDGPIARAVNDVTASGALYFSSAANSGNVTSGTAGVWEGDFNAGPASATPLPTGYTLHLFNASQAYNVLVSSNNRAFLKWSDPLGASTNDYDLFVLNAAGTAVICAATNIQSGTQEPYEYCGATTIVGGNRIVVAKKATAAVRALRLDTYRGTLSIATNGAIFGHNGGSNTQSVAAVSWNSARSGSRPFVGGAANPTESFSSDGPRRLFYTPAGVAITPGNVLFGSNGGVVLSKPDIAAADGAFSRTPAFNPFYGTSAAAPHAAAIAALVKSARPDYTPAQIVAAMKATALDIRAAGIDIDSGSGIVMAWEAVQYALTH